MQPNASEALSAIVRGIHSMHWAVYFSQPGLRLTPLGVFPVDFTSPATSLSGGFNLASNLAQASADTLFTHLSTPVKPLTVDAPLPPWWPLLGDEPGGLQERTLHYYNTQMLTIRLVVECMNPGSSPPVHGDECTYKAAVLAHALSTGGIGVDQALAGIPDSANRSILRRAVILGGQPPGFVVPSELDPQDGD